MAVAAADRPLSPTDNQQPGFDDEPVLADAETAPGTSPLVTGLAAAASAGAAAWMVTGIFRDPVAHLVALVGVAIGAGFVIISQRVRGASIMQWLVPPVAALVGAALVAPDAHGGSSTLPGLIADSVRSGGLLQPPIAFDPGWRFILVFVFALLAAGAAALAINLNRPQVGALIPIPLVIGAALIQPAASEIVTTAVALLLVVLAMALAYGADLGSNGPLGAGFEIRRVGRGAVAAVGLCVLLLALSRAGFLFPSRTFDRTIPPQAPQTTSEPDRPLFSYTINRPVPLRLGAIDVYDQKDSTWKLPEYNAKRLRVLSTPARIPGSAAPSADSVVATIHIADSRGHGLPALMGLEQVKGTNQSIDFDPRTGAIRLADKPVYNGLTYTVVASPQSTAKQLEGAAPPDVEASFLAIPQPPNEVTLAISEYSQAVARLGIPENAFDRLQYLRNVLLQHVVAAGAGTPGPVTPAQVGRMMAGADASPYEITAAEAMLARWAGVPARIGYGYYGGDQQSGGAFVVRPKDGSTFLEVYFRGSGWIDLIGTPPKARPSTSQAQKNQQPNVHESDELALTVHVPIRVDSPHLLFEYVRYWLVVASGPIAALVLMALLYPWFFKLGRRYRRRRWANRNGLLPRIGVAYAEFRDSACDLTVGDPSATPVEFLSSLRPDREHEELAWLVTRAFWGDLRRDLRVEDAESCERLARSLTRRFLNAQPALNRVLGASARSSLRAPYTRAVPNLWPQLRMASGGGIRQRLRAIRHSVRLMVSNPRRALAGPAAALLSILFLASCGGSPAVARRKMPAGLVPASIGSLTLNRDVGSENAYKLAGPASLAQEGRIYLVEHADVIEGSLQVSLFKPEVDTSDITDEASSQLCTTSPDDCPGHQIFIGIQKQFGSGTFRRVYYRGQRAYFMQVAEPKQTLYLWFPPGTETMMMLDLRSQFPPDSAAELFRAMIDFQTGHPLSPVTVPTSGQTVVVRSPQ